MNRKLVAFLASGAALLVAIVLSEYLLVPPALEPFARAVYRVAFWLTLPLRVLVRAYNGDARLRPPPWLWIPICFGTPFAIAAGLFAIRRVARALEDFARALRRLARPPSAPTSAASSASPPPHASSPRAGDDPALTRRGFLERAGTVSLFAIGGSTGVYATYLEPAMLRTRRYELPIRGLPPELDGFRVAHVSDTHYGPYATLRYLRAVVDRANALEPDLVALTGDYILRTWRAIDDGIGVFAGLSARRGAVAVLGNHDHWEDAEACRAAFRGIGVPLLDNRRMALTRHGWADVRAFESRPGETLCVAGAGDWWTRDTDFDAALGGVPEDVPRLLLTHNPDAIDWFRPDHRVDLALCGHTHGGQVNLPLIGAPFTPSRYGERFVGGLCRGHTGPVVVSRGVGMAGAPIRLGVPPEIGLIVLRRAETDSL